LSLRNRRKAITRRGKVQLGAGENLPPAFPGGKKLPQIQRREWGPWPKTPGDPFEIVFVGHERRGLDVN